MQLFLLVHLSYVAIIEAVDRCHSDRDKDHRPRENCTGAGFRDVPAGFEPKTKVLLFPRNRFTSLSWSSFQTFTEIYEIDLTGNEVPEVTPSPAPVLRSLSILRLGSNLLTALSDGSFSACPALTELYLDNNSISSLRDHTFSGLSKLEILDLSSNDIRVLPKLMLKPLAAIETLYLENNKIKVMPDGWFIKEEGLPYLYLSVNPWACNCSLTYLHKYLNEYEFNVYVRDGPIISSDAESVVCEFPQLHKGKAVISLEESDLCPEENPDVAAEGLLGTEVVTWSWYQTTQFMEQSHLSAPLGRGDGSVGGSRSLSPAVTVTSGTEGPGAIVIITATEPAAFKSTSSTETSTEPKLPQSAASFATEAATTTPPWLVISTAAGPGRWGRVGANRAAALLCFWLFVVCLLLCITSAACAAATAVWLLLWYRRVYKPASRRTGGQEVALLALSAQDEMLAGAKALHRSVLYVHREEEAAERGAEGGKEQVLINLEPTAAGGGAAGEEAEEQRSVYRKTLYRLMSKEEEIEGWRDVGRKVWDEGGRMGGRTGGGVSRRSYSVILREQREETGGRREELDWVVGAWEVQEAEPRSSWGAWLSGFLPSRPWGLAPPPGDDAAL